MKIALFVNTKREGKNDPDLTGRITDDSGNELHSVSLWLNTSKVGTQYYSGYVKEPKNSKQQQ